MALQIGIELVLPMPMPMPYDCFRKGTLNSQGEEGIENSAAASIISCEGVSSSSIGSLPTMRASEFQKNSLHCFM